ncbi:MAG TPA: hypothetical protein VLM40_07600, partial [Gemmata sp.]|nr:hypothetical protein [Gemmata sp.]
GDPTMPSAHLPSNPRAYLHTQTPTPRRASAAVSATMLARTIGISEGDREFMSKCVKDLAERMPKKGITPETLAKELFTRKPFADAFQTGNIPDREEFKDLFVDALTELAKAHKVEPLELTRGDYASGPSGAVVPGREYREPVAVPTTACLRCHDVRGAGKPSAFNPIPLLAFDPFDATSREAWIKKTNARDRAAVLAKMAKRLNTDRDMPPEDSAEFEKFRQQEAASFAAIQDWLAAELKKAKGN